VEQKTIPLGQQPARLWTGGTGEAIVLLHGQWAGAEAYWDEIAENLERSHRVVAPELPGIGDSNQPLLSTFGGYAAWLNELLTALQIDKATIVGNSFGAAVAWRFAGDYPERCESLVMVNGYPPPVYSPRLRWLVAHTPVRAMARGNLLRQHYGADVLDLAFHDKAKVPAAVSDTLKNFTRDAADRVLDMLLSGEAVGVPPRARTLLIFGETDKVPPLDKNGARKMRSVLTESKLVTIPEAGHMPQVERPKDFIHALRNFLRIPK
jgi:pimeloyl-ACP methyl ester carboxylesterase